MSPDLLKEMIAALLPVFDRLVEQNAGAFGKIAWRILRPLLLDNVAVAKAMASLPPELQS